MTTTPTSDEEVIGWTLYTGFDDEEPETTFFEETGGGDGFYAAVAFAKAKFNIPNEDRFTYPDGFCILVERRPYRIRIAANWHSS